MNVEKILTNLENIGFSRKEGEVFIELLKNPNSNGSQIAKTLGYPRTTVYQNLDLLEKKGYIKSYLDKERTYYEVIDIDEFLEGERKKVEDSTKILKKEFETIQVLETQKQFYNINSLESIEKRISQMLIKAEKEVYINTNIDLGKFKKEFKKLKEKNVKIILFSSHKLNYEKVEDIQKFFKEVGVTTYIRDTFDYNSSGKDIRIMMAVDAHTAIIASNYEGEFNGTYSENKLLATIVKEHIVNDINLTRLEEKHGKELLKEVALVL